MTKLETSVIPKIIHYCWFGGKRLPREVKACIRSWEKSCPDYHIVRWDESNFDVSGHPFCKSAYEDGAWAFVSDYARLKVIHDCGGIYLDTDVEVIKCLDFLLGYECFLGVQQEKHVCNTGLGFGAEAGHPVICELLKKYDEVTYDPSRKKDLACPVLNTEVLAALGYSYADRPVSVCGAEIYPPSYFDPISPGPEGKNLLCDQTYSIHHYSNSWGTREDALRRKLIRLIGPVRVAKLKDKLKDMLYG